MHPKGLMLIGEFIGVEPVTKKDGSTVPGFSRIMVNIARDGAEAMPSDATFNTADRDTGEPSNFAQVLSQLKPKPGDLLVVKVKPTTNSGSGFVNRTAIDVAPFAAVAGFLGQ